MSANSTEGEIRDEVPPTPASTAGASNASPSPQQQPQQREDIRFDPRRIMSALVFHACEEGKVEEVSPSSIRGTLRRLVRQKISAIVSRERWAAMTNPQRLEWLLKVSRTIFEASPEGYGILSERAAAAGRK